MSSMNNSEHTHLIKILMLGNCGVGKRTIQNIVIDGDVKDATSLFGISLKTNIIDINNKKIKVQLWAINGKALTLTSSFYRGARGLMLVYDITNLESFEAIRQHLKNIRKAADPKIPIVLIGNKMDLEDQRVITTQDGQELAAKYAIDFIETSIALNTHTKTSVDKFIMDIYNKLGDKLLNVSPLTDDNDTPKKAMPGKFKGKYLFALSIPVIFGIAYSLIY
jgi:Ras-related protein Rab-8A